MIPPPNLAWDLTLTHLRFSGSVMVLICQQLDRLNRLNAVYSLSDDSYIQLSLISDQSIFIRPDIRAVMTHTQT